jgi:predicted aspartyl protease
VSQHPYDRERFDPPAPVVPLVLASPSDAERVAIPALLDSGADVTLVPPNVARELRLPRVDRLEIRGIGSRVHMADVCAAVVRIGRFRTLARVVLFGDEALVGRDLLNRLLLRLDGPQEMLDSRAPRRTTGPS